MQHESPIASASEGSPSATVVRFFDLLEEKDVDGACDLLAEDVRYMNVSLPTIRGRERTRRAMSVFRRPSAHLKVYMHHIGGEGSTVLTERTDVISFGPVSVQIWVWGHFDVVDGEIVLWKDYFDWLNAGVAMLRGLLGAVVPSLRPKPPSDPA